MSCQSNTCISTGKTSSDISLDSGRTWKVLKGQGFYTLSSDKGVFIAAGANGTVGIMDLTKNLDNNKRVTSVTYKARAPL